MNRTMIAYGREMSSDNVSAAKIIDGIECLIHKYDSLHCIDNMLLGKFRYMRGF
jgi:hypothetical protein